jgi:hypothetical protein
MTSEGSHHLGDGWWYRIVGQSRSGTVGIDTPSAQSILRRLFLPRITAGPEVSCSQLISVALNDMSAFIIVSGGLNLLFLVTVLAEKIKLKWRWKMISL